MYNLKNYEYLTDYSRKIREKVFVEEQKFQNEFDDKEDSSLHFVLFNDDKAVGTARMFTEDNGKTYHIGRIAVLKEYRGEHLGSKLVNAACEKAKDFGAEKCLISAQCRVKGFYNTLGFKEYGEEYLDEYCPHISMEKEL